MLTLATYRYAAQRGYYLLIPNVLTGWLHIHSKDGLTWEVKPVPGSNVPDRGTMVREYTRNSLPVPAQDALTAYLSGALWTVHQPASMREKPSTATLSLFNVKFKTHESYPYVSSSLAIEDARNFTRENKELRATVTSRTLKDRVREDGGSTRFWILVAGGLANTIDVWDSGRIEGYAPLPEPKEEVED